MLWAPAASGALGALLSLLAVGRREARAQDKAPDRDAAPGPGASPAARARAVELSVAGVLAALGALVALVLSLGYIADYSPGSHGLSHVTDVVWIGELGIHYKLGIDGLNVFLVGLAALLFAAAVLAANLRRWERPRLFYFNLMLAESAILGALLSQDLALFVAFFDLMLIPFIFLTGQWGGRDRIRATIKFVIYTLVGSLLMLSAAIATGVLATPDGGSISFALSDLRQNIVDTGSQDWIFPFFCAAFLVKMPAFPIHGWMPDAYRAMPLE